MNERERRPADELSRLREQIDRIDETLLEALSARARVAREVAEAKDRRGEGGDYYRPEREAQVLRRMVESNPGPLDGAVVAHLFQEIISACRAQEAMPRVACLGPGEPYCEAAALQCFGGQIHLEVMASVAAVFAQVESRAADFGVVPVENAAGGVVSPTLELLMFSPLSVCGEVQLWLRHALYARPGTGVGAIERVYASQRALSLCRRWLDESLAGAARIEAADEAEALGRASEDPRAAGIARADAPRQPGLQILVYDLEDGSACRSRFLVIGTQTPSPSGHDRTSLLLGIGDQPGALHQLIEPFARRGVSLSHIESRPARVGATDSVFFVDVDGHCQDEAVAGALAEVKQRAALYKLLGSYPRAVPR